MYIYVCVCNTRVGVYMYFKITYTQILSWFSQTVVPLQ